MGEDDVVSEEWKIDSVGAEDFAVGITITIRRFYWKINAIERLV